MFVEQVTFEGVRVASDGWGAQTLSQQGSDGLWVGAASNRDWDSTMHQRAGRGGRCLLWQDNRALVERMQGLAFP